MRQSRVVALSLLIARSAEETPCTCRVRELTALAAWAEVYSDCSSTGLSGLNHSGRRKTV